MASDSMQPTKNKVAAGVLAIVVGGLGIHKFYLGYIVPGIVLLVASIISIVTAIILIGVVGLLVIAVICLIEGILYLTKSDEEFHEIYVVNRKSWF